MGERADPLPPRTMLFVPATKVDEYLVKAEAARPDAIILDLEDAVADAQKDWARDKLRSVLATVRREPPVFVRVNAPDTRWFANDISVAALRGASGIVLPKCQDATVVAAAIDAYRSLRSASSDREFAVVPLIETPKGVLAAFDIASADPSIIGMAFGAEDLAAALGGQKAAYGQLLLVARSLLVLAATAAHRWTVDSPTIEFRRLELVRRDAARSKELGFVGKLVIHPSHIALVHEAFRVRPGELRHAKATIRAAGGSAGGAGASTGVISVDGRMVDRPVLLAALETLERAERE